MPFNKIVLGIALDQKNIAGDHFVFFMIDPVSPIPVGNNDQFREIMRMANIGQVMLMLHGAVAGDVLYRNRITIVAEKISSVGYYRFHVLPCRLFRNIVLVINNIVKDVKEARGYNNKISEIFLC